MISKLYTQTALYNILNQRIIVHIARNQQQLKYVLSER